MFTGGQRSAQAICDTSSGFTCLFLIAIIFCLMCFFAVAIRSSLRLSPAHYSFQGLEATAAEKQWHSELAKPDAIKDQVMANDMQGNNIGLA